MKAIRNGKANSHYGVIRVLGHEQLPNGVQVVTVPCNDYSDLYRLPPAVEYKGVRYGMTGWNSDRHVAYFRTDANLAEVL